MTKPQLPNNTDNKTLPFRLAMHYLTSKRKDGSIAFMSKLCFCGIFVGTLALMLTLIIMTGFEHTIHKKIRGINAQATIYSPGNKLDYHGMRQRLFHSYGPVLRAISGGSTRQVILSCNDNQAVLYLKSIDATNEIKTTCLEKKITHSNKKTDLTVLLQGRNIIIGHKVAKTHGLSIGDKIQLLIPEPSRKNKILLDEQEVTISGMLNVGLEEYDSNMAYCSLDLFYDLFDGEEGVDQLYLAFKENAEVPGTKHTWFNSAKNTLRRLIPFTSTNNETKIINMMRTTFPTLKIKSWMEMYPALISSLKLEKYVMAFILALITMVASMNMLSLLFMQVRTKRGDIAILKAMGMPGKQVRKIFVTMGLIIAVAASILGLTCAFTIGLLIQKFPIIKLPDIYYVSHLPAHLDLSQFIAVLVATLIIGFIATWIPARLAQKVSITEVLRQD